jgi:hypothetical protein
MIDPLSPVGWNGASAPLTDVCKVCGASPTAHVSFQQNIGLLFMRHTKKWEGLACQDCGRSIGRKLMNLTLVTGWTGIISAITNFGAIGKNASSLAKLNKLSAPLNRPPTAPSPGRPIFARPGVLGLAAVVGFFVYSIAIAPREIPIGEWAAGTCLDVSSKSNVTGIDCTKDHGAVVLSKAPSEDLCPETTTGTIENTALGGGVFCVQRLP